MCVCTHAPMCVMGCSDGHLSCTIDLCPFGSIKSVWEVVCVYICHLSSSFWPIQASHLWHGSRAPRPSGEPRDAHGQHGSAQYRDTGTATAELQWVDAEREIKVLQRRQPDLLEVLEDVSPLTQEAPSGLTDWWGVQAFNPAGLPSYQR